jgi:enamine deaminase RidA (YjgF/YER057c/UK114 family)
MPVDPLEQRFQTLDEATQAGLIAAVILDRPTCLVCLAARVGMTPLGALRTSERIGTTLRLTGTERDACCQQCGSTLEPVYSLARPE